jgi:hypothetical protein
VGAESFLFSFFYFRFFPWFPSPREKERERKNEERKGFANVIKVGNEFSIFVFLFSFLALVSVPQGEREKKEE